MYFKYLNNIIDIPTTDDESKIELHIRLPFILKNYNTSKFTIEDVLNLSFVYKNMKLLKCRYTSEIEDIIHNMSTNVFLKL